MLKLQFDANQGYQKQAIDSIVNIFNGQEIKHSKFTALTHRDTFGEIRELGIANKLDLDDSDILNNVINIQDSNHLSRTKKDIRDSFYGVPNFTTEMETGTGKTYVYTRTIFELNQKYGFMKFIIVVPSIAIKEGVYKSLQITQEHFKGLYPGQSFDYFIYDSSNISDVKNFATSNCIEVMIINVQAFEKSFKDVDDKDSKANLIHRENDKLQGRKPIEFIQETRPIVIIDEPQSVDNTANRKNAIMSLSPLFILRYSATHKEVYNLMYKLGPVEAYENRLVKRIEVCAPEIAGTDNLAYIKLLKVENTNGYKAKIDINVLENGSTKKKNKIVKVNTNLFELSGDLDKYKGYIISNISCEPGMEYLEFESGNILKLSASWGDYSNNIELKRFQIKSTIESHLEKELVRTKKGIKVLSLFFIDKVSKYRIYNEDGSVSDGEYAKIFKEEYSKLIKSPKYNQLLSSEFEKKYILNENIEDVCKAYFAQDKNIIRDTNGNTNTDNETYDLIMKDKERLLSFENNTRFIFSHSALKEGWDNPNVFQVCTLVESKTEFTKRQKIGRGLRLPVNQDGVRIQDEQINILTVIANESYEEFAESLQTEIENETNLKFGIIEPYYFKDILIKKENILEEIGHEKSESIYNYLLQKQYINNKGKVQEILKEAIVKDQLELPEEFKKIKTEIIDKIKQSIKKLPLLNIAEKTKVKLKKEILLTPEFNNLWNRIKYKTTYRVNFNENKFIDNCIMAVQKMNQINPNTVLMKWVNLDINRKGVITSDPSKFRTMVINEHDNNLPDILRHIESQTKLKRSTIVEILIASGRLEDVYINPQIFMEEVSDVIKSVKIESIIDGIKYKKIGDQDCYTQELFENSELIGYLKSNAEAVNKSIYDYVLYESEIERQFAEKLDKDSDVKLFIKLPSTFKIDTPLGGYNPDWAVLIDKNGEERLYFIIETKGSIKEETLRKEEIEKIKCGRKHFESLDTGIKYELASDYNEWRKGI